MQEALQYYLLRNRNLPLPGLGCIFIERTAAAGDFVNKQLLPPSFQFRFDKYFDSPDKDFFQFLSARTGMADFEAIKWYNEWAYSLRNDIRNNRTVVLEGVGTLRRDESGEIGFLPESGLQNFLEPVPAHRVIPNNSKHSVRMGDRELSKEQALDEIEESRVDDEKSWKLWAGAIAILAVAFLVYHFINNGFGTNAVGNLQKLKDWF